MCTGFELIAALLSGVGSFVGVAGQAQAYEAQAQQNRNNAVIAQRNAEDARQRGVAAEQDVQLRNRARVGMQKNVLSERNIALSGGTALDILGDTAMFGKLDALTTRHNFEREAIAHEAQRSNFNAQAEIDSLSARNAMFQGGISAFSTALGGIGQAHYRRQQSRRFA